jgi:hypothetical protein
VWFIGCPPRQVVMPQWCLREIEDRRREIEERHRPKPESTVDHSPTVIPTPRASSAAKQTQLKDIDEDDERNDEKDDETPKNDMVGDRSVTDQAQDPENSLTHTHTPGAHTPDDGVGREDGRGAGRGFRRGARCPPYVHGDLRR